MKIISILIFLCFGQDTFAFQAKVDTVVFKFTNSRNKDWSIESLDKIFPIKIPDHIQYAVIKGANHNFELGPFCSDKTRNDLKYSSQFQTLLKNYIVCMLR